MTSLKRLLVLREIYGYDDGIAEYNDTPVVMINNVPYETNEQEILDCLLKKGYILVFEGDKFHSILTSKDIEPELLFDWNEEIINWTDII